MATSKHVPLHNTELFSQDEEAKRSTQVALTMGAFSISLLLVVSALLSALHSIVAK